MSRMPPRPPDECPYHKPFADGFDGCPAYQKQQFVPLNTQYAAMESVWTCSNLDFGRIPRRNWRHYGRCRLGDTQRRLEWVVEVRDDRLAVVRAMQRDLSPLLAQQTVELWSAKGRQLASPHGSQEFAAATSDLLHKGNQFLTACEAYFEEHSAEMDLLSLPIDTTMNLFRELIYRWVDQPNAEIPTVSESALERFPEEARILFTPPAA
jgi:hypothetical protein